MAISSASVRASGMSLADFVIAVSPVFTILTHYDCLKSFLKFEGISYYGKSE